MATYHSSLDYISQPVKSSLTGGIYLKYLYGPKHQVLSEHVTIYVFNVFIPKTAL